MAVRLKQLRPSRTALRCARAGDRVLIYPRGPHKQAVFDFVKWCATEPGYTVVALWMPDGAPPEALEDVVEDLALCPGVLRLIPARSGTDTTVAYGEWLARRLGRTVVAHEGAVAVVPGGGLYIPPGEAGGAGWLCIEPGEPGGPAGTPAVHSRRFPRPGWDCAPFAEPYPLGEHATAEPLPAGSWIRPVGDSREVKDFRSWLLGGMAPDPLLPRIVLGYPGSPVPPLGAVAEFWRSLPTATHPAVRFSGFSGTDEESAWYGQRLADALDVPVVLGNGVQVVEPSAAGGYETRTVLRRGVMAWTPYVFDLGYLPARSTGGVPADPVAIGHRAPIVGLREREPGVYEYSHDAVLEVTQSGLWIRPHVLPSDSFQVRTELADPAHAMVVFDASAGTGAHRMQLLATEMVQRLEPRVRGVARILASTATGSLVRDRVDVRDRLAVLDRPAQAEAAAEAPAAPTGNGAGLDDSFLNLSALTDAAPQAPVPSRVSGIDPADLAAGATLHIPIEALLARLAADAGEAGGDASAPGESGESGDESSLLADLDDVAVPPAIALYALAWDAEVEGVGHGADLVSRAVGAEAAEAAEEQAPAILDAAGVEEPADAPVVVLADQPVDAPVVVPADAPVADWIPPVSDAVIEPVPALGRLEAAPVRTPTADSVAAEPNPVADFSSVVISASPVADAAAPAPPLVSGPTVAERLASPPEAREAVAAELMAAAPVVAEPLVTTPLATVPLVADSVPTPIAAVTPDFADAPAPSAPNPVVAPVAEFTVTRRRQRKSRAVPTTPPADAAASTPAAELPQIPEPLSTEAAPRIPESLSTEAPPRIPESLSTEAPPRIPEPLAAAPAIEPPVGPSVAVVPPTPEPVEEPDEPISYGAFQLVSSIAPAAPAAPAPEPPRAPARPTRLTPQTPLIPPTPPPAEQPAPAAPPPAAVPEPAVLPAPEPAVPVAPAAKRRPARPAKSSVLVQPVPTARCSVVPREGGLEKERDWLRRNLSKQYDAAASSVARILSEHPGLRAGSSASDSDVLTDLVALRLYLTGKISGLDEAVRAAQVGPHVPLARCVAAGLRRLPSYRGPARTRVTLTAEELAWYGGRSLVTEWSFLPAVVSSSLDLPGAVEVLVWSMSARRTGLLDPSRPDQVVFQPGTSFKVLSVGTGPDGPEVRLRELTRTEVAADGTVQSLPALDEFAAAALEETGKAWRQVDPVQALPADRRDWFAAAPGLLAPAARGVEAGAKEGGKA